MAACSWAETVDDRSGTAPREESVDELERLLDDPAGWAALDADKLRHLLFFQALSYGLQPDESRIEGLMALHALAVERLHPSVRRQVVVRLARAVERVHREHDVHEGAGCTNALLPFLLEDPDPSVVSSAATELALLLPPEGGDVLTGPRYTRSLFDKVRSDDARAGILAGLLQLGDARLGPLVTGGWRVLGAEGHETLALLIQAFHGVHPLLVEFLVGWLEDEARAPNAAAFGIVAATLARAGRHAAENGVSDVRRVFPVTAAPEGQPFEEARTVTREALAATIEPRLSAIAAAENPPVLMPHVLSYWGFELAAYRIAVRAAADAARPTADPATGACAPAPVDLLPGWPDDPDHESLIEWGGADPSGPSLATMRLTPVGGGAALVVTVYKPGASASHVLAVFAAPPDSRRIAAAVDNAMAANGDGGVWLLQALPAYVELPAGSPIGRHEAARGIAAAHRRGLAAGEHPLSDYAAWIEAAGRPEQVAAGRAATMEAWRRLQQQGKSDR